MASRRRSGLVLALSACLLGGCDGREVESTPIGADASHPEDALVFDGLALVAAPGEPGAVILRNVGDEELELSGLRIVALDGTGRALPGTAVDIEGDGLLDPGEERLLQAPGPRVALVGPEGHVLLRAAALAPRASR